MPNVITLIFALQFLIIQLNVCAEKYCVCQKDSVPQLSEIIISGNRKPILKKQDTTVYRVEAFKTGNEKLLQDLLEKIPGMKVDPYSGKLSYFGRTIQSVKLDGADLTGSDYMNLTRNISSDLIDEIEAIDNDPDNPLLKEIQPSGKLVLNLKLKKTKSQYNGEAFVGLGLMQEEQPVTDIKANLLGLADKIKSFVSAGFNNRGMNYGSFNYFDYQAEEKKDFDEYKLSPFIASSLQPQVLSQGRYLMNQNCIINGNFLMQPKSVYSSVRLSVFGMTDYIKGYTNQNNQYHPETKIPATSDDIIMRFSPIYFKALMEWKQSLSPKLWLKTTLFAERNHNLEEVQQVLNQQSSLKVRINQEQFRYHHQLDLTYKLGRWVAIRGIMNMGDHDLNELMRWSELLQQDSIQMSQAQNILNRRKIIECSILLSAKRKNHDYEIESGLKKSYNIFHSGSLQFDSIPMNQMKQNYDQVYFVGGGTYRFGNWSLKPKIKISFNEFQVIGTNNENLVRPRTVFEPELSINKRLSDQLKWVNMLSVQNRHFSDRPYFDYPVRVSVRQININQVSPDLQNIIGVQSRLIYQDLFRQLNGQIQLSYVQFDRMIVPQMRIDARNMLTYFLILEKPGRRYAVQASGEKYLSKLRSTFSFETNYSLSRYYNFINNDQIRNNAIHTFDISGKTSATLFKHMSMVYSVRLTTLRAFSSDASLQENIQVSDFFQVMWHKQKQFFIRIMAERLYPQWAASYSVFFLDAEILCKPVGRKYSFSLVGKNLLNEPHLKQVLLSDYASSILVTRLIPAYLMLEWSVRF